MSMSLLQMSFAGAVMVLAVTTIRALSINKLPKKTFLLLWGAALLRLLVPFSVPSRFSVYSLVERSTAAIGTINNVPATNLLPLIPAEQTSALTSASTKPAVSIWFVVWVIGTLAFALLFAAAYWKCRQEFQTSLPVNNDFTVNWLSSHPLKRSISIRQSSRISAPLTYGVFRPVILMPKSIKWTNTSSLQYVLAHEYVHIKRFDVITKLVLIAALCVHWFNPMVWVMYILANRDIELSCDEAVVRSFGEKAKSAYARTLISMEETRSGLMPLCNNFSKNAIEERITAIMKIKKTTVVSFVLACTVLAGTTIAFATSATAVGNKKNNEQPRIVESNDDSSDSVYLPLGSSSLVISTDGATVGALEPTYSASSANDTSIDDKNATVNAPINDLTNGEKTYGSLSRGSKVIYGKVFLAARSTITLSIACEREVEFKIVLTSVDTGKTFEGMITGTGTTSIQADRDNDYIITIENCSLLNAKAYTVNHMID